MMASGFESSLCLSVSYKACRLESPLFLVRWYLTNSLVLEVLKLAMGVRSPSIGNKVLAVSAERSLRIWLATRVVRQLGITLSLALFGFLFTFSLLSRVYLLF